MTIKSWAISPTLNTMTMVQIIFPFTYVPLLTILRLKVSKSVCLIVSPVTFICISVWTPKLSFAIGLIIIPFTFILCFIWPLLNSISTLFALLIDVSSVVSIFSYFKVFYIGQLMLFNHLSKFLNLLLRSAIISLKVLLANCIHLLLCLHTWLEMMLRFFSLGFFFWLTDLLVMLLKLALSKDFTTLLDHGRALFWWRATFRAHLKSLISLIIFVFL